MKIDTQPGLVTLHDKRFKSFISAAEIKRIVDRLAQEISTSIEKSQSTILLPVLNGAFVFAADLVRAFPEDCDLGFIRMHSYAGLQSSGVVKVSMMFEKDEVNGKEVIVIEDIIETGTTLVELKQILQDCGALTVKIATLLLKPDCLTHELQIDFVGKEIPNDFVVGYGMDYNGLGRTLPDIYHLV